MARKVLISVAASVAVLACTVLPTLAQDAPAPSAPAAPAVPTANGADRLPAVLANPDAPQAERDEAARRLVLMGSPEATETLRAIVVDTANPRGQQSVARALADDPTPDPVFIIPLNALIGSDVTSTDAGARGLANFRGNSDARRYLLEAATDAAHKLPGPSRVAVIRSLAPLADKRAAEALVNIVTNDAEGMATRNAAADELAEMTGFTGAGRDAQRWRQWWNDNQAKPEAQLESELLAARAGRLDRLEPRHERLVAELRALLTEGFGDVPAASKEQVLLSYLRSPVGEVRQVGAGLIVDLFEDRKPIPDRAREQLRTMVGDSDEQVRLQVAGAVQYINDKGALDAVLAQLAVERDPAVRAALAEALAPMGDARAVPVLVGLLRDNSLAAVQAAARSLEGLRSQLPAVAPNVSRDVSLALNDALGRTGGPGTVALREQIVAAMVAWAHADVAQTFKNLLKPNEPASIRREALRYFGQMGSDMAWPADNIVNSGSLEDRDDSVRLAAVEALARTAQSEHAQKLYERLKPGDLGPETEPSAEVRDEAWKGLAAMFPRVFDIERLNAWADRFKEQPERRLTILEALKDQLREKRLDNELAVVRQNIGETHMKLGQFDKAAVEFKGALEAPGRQNQVKDLLVSQLLEAYLRAKNYGDATRFGAQVISQNPGSQTVIGPAITNEVGRLHLAGDADGALRLVTLALKMDPPLAPSFTERLRKIEPELRRKVGTATTAPSS